MKKGHLNTFLLLGISIVVCLVSFVSSTILYQSAKDSLWASSLESGNSRVREISGLLETQLESGLSREQVIENLQKSIVNTDIGKEFICMYDTKGVELCHPNPALIGKKINLDDSELALQKNDKNATFLEILNAGKLHGGIRSFPKDSRRSSEIVNVYPVSGTDWMVASHVKIPQLLEQLSDLYLKFLIGFLLSAIIITACSYAFVRMMYRKYEARMQLEVDALNLELTTLSILNSQLGISKKKEQDEPPVSEFNFNVSEPKTRLTTYHKDELVSITLDTVAFVFLQDGVNYLRTFSNESYSMNDSLDELMKQLDHHDFYRANRQFIVNLKAIATIYMFGKNQLKLVTKPASPIELVISKNKVAEFKQWLDR